MRFKCDFFGGALVRTHETCFHCSEFALIQNEASLLYYKNKGITFHASKRLH